MVSADHQMNRFDSVSDTNSVSWRPVSGGARTFYLCDGDSEERNDFEETGRRHMYISSTRIPLPAMSIGNYVGTLTGLWGDGVGFAISRIIMLQWNKRGRRSRFSSFFIFFFFWVSFGVFLVGDSNCLFNDGCLFYVCGAFVNKYVLVFSLILLFLL